MSPRGGWSCTMASIALACRSAFKQNKLDHDHFQAACDRFPLARRLIVG